MAERPPISETVKGMILAYHNEGYNNSQIARMLQIDGEVCVITYRNRNIMVVWQHARDPVARKKKLPQGMTVHWLTSAGVTRF